MKDITSFRGGIRRLKRIAFGHFGQESEQFSSKCP